MRRALRPNLPALAYLYGLRWEHIEVMPAAELNAYLAVADDFMKRSG